MRLLGSLLLAGAVFVVMLAGAELVLRRSWEPRSYTLAPFVKTRTITPEYDVEYATNRQGFRDIGHPDHFNRVAVIGDSFVFGSGVAADDLMTARLQKSLWSLPTAADVHNFGVPGTGPFNALYLWRDYIRRLRPHVVVVALYAGNDASDALREAQSARPRLVTVAQARVAWHRIRAWWQNRKHADPVDNVQAQQRRKAHGWNAFGLDNPATLDHLLEVARERGVPEDSIRARYNAIPDSLVNDALEFRSNPFNLAEAVLDPDGLRHNLLLDTRRMDEGWGALETALGRLKHEVEGSQAPMEARLVLVCIPAAVQVDTTYWWLKHLGVRLDRRVIDEPVFQQRLAAFTTREGIPYIDLLPVMRSRPDERLYYQQDGHWNAAGHALAAQAIGERIREWLPPVPEGIPQR